MPLPVNKSGFNFNHADQVENYGPSVGDYQIVQSNFDSRAEELRVFVNSLLDSLKATDASSQLGHSSPSITAATIGAALEENRLLIIANNNGVVKTTTDQMISGNKTFLLPITIPITPTDNAHGASKGYVDAVIAGVVLGQIPDNSLTEAKMANEMKKQAGGVYPFDSGQSNADNIVTLQTRASLIEEQLINNTWTGGAW